MKLTTPDKIENHKNKVDVIIEKIEDGFKQVTKTDENDMVRITIDGDYSLQDKQKVKSIYEDAGWGIGNVSFMTFYPEFTAKTRFSFKKTTK